MKYILKISIVLVLLSSCLSIPISESNKNDLHTINEKTEPEQNTTVNNTSIHPEKPISKKDYIPQHKISDPPQIPTSELLKRIKYPIQANKDKIEGIVYIELYIDTKGIIRKIDILRTPGTQFTEAVLKAFEGLICEPALSDGKPVPVRYRYPIRFKLSNTK